MYDTTTHYTEHFAHSEFNKQGDPGPIAANNIHRLCNDILEPARPHSESGEIDISKEGGFRPLSIQQAIWDNASQAERDAGLVAHPGHSQHEVGNAADILQTRMGIPRLYDYLESNPAVGGLGIYLWGIHVDRRPRDGGPIARWGMTPWWK